jgi:hypothetical protein
MSRGASSGFKVLPELPIERLGKPEPMRLEQSLWSGDRWSPAAPGRLGPDAQLVLVFGSRPALQRHDLLDEIRRAYPCAHVTGCSTAGEICGTQVRDDTLVVTAIAFAGTRVVVASQPLTDGASGVDAGARLAASLAPHDLRHVLLLSDGLHVNGSELVQGLTSRLPPRVTVTGGLSADGPRFERTVVIVNGEPQERAVVAVGLCGDRLHVGYGSVGGWDPFGPERVVTAARGNVLYELDGQSALSLYKRYLGDKAAELPASGLLFPLRVRGDRQSRGLVRTILSVNDADDSMTFAGDIPDGGYAQLMRANFDRLIDGAAEAAAISAASLDGHAPALALLISCVGRRMVLKQRVEEEVEGVRDIVGPHATLTGFYSYGEIAPFAPNASCELHNQTMTVTTLSETCDARAAA